MKISLKNNLLFISLLIISTSFVGQEIQFKASPKWVIEKSVPVESEVNKYDVNNGVYTSLYDLQHNLNKTAEFLHVGLNVLSYGGVKNASEIYITYDSSYQTIDFHYIYIWRNGNKIDRTNELTFETLNNETNLQSGIYSGKVTAYDILEDIRKGDVIEYAYTTNGQNPIFNGHQYNVISLATSNPIDEIFIRFVIDAKKPVQFKCSECDDLKVSEETFGSNKEFRISGKNIATVKYEESASSSQIQYPFANISTFNSWEEVEKWAIDVFTLTEKQDLSDVEQEIYNEDMKQEDKINAIINYVQDEIRYMGIESGIGSHKPFAPEQVVKQRFGDCKDKSLLAVELLKRIGVEEAYPVLVASYMKKGLNQFLESGQIFDHCILYFEYRGKPYWVDPTIASQGGDFKTMVTPDYGDVMIIGKNKYDLSNMNLKDETTHAVVIEEIDASSFTEPSTIKVTTIFYGSKADMMRSTFEYYSKTEIEDSYKEMYAKLFPKITVKEPLKIKEDEDKNEFTIVETYSVEGLWKKETNEFIEKSTFQYEPIALYSYVNNLECEPKKYKVAIPEPSWISMTTTIKYPDILNLEDEEKRYSNAGFIFNKTYQVVDKTTLVGKFEFKVKTDEIEAADFPKLCDDINELVNDLPFQIYFSKFNYNTKEDKKEVKSKPISKGLQTEIIKIKEKYSADKTIETEDEDLTFTLVEKMPEFPGGSDSLLAFIARNVKYPEYERKEKIEGTVYATYIVDETGKVVEAEIVRSVKNSKNFDAEVLRMLNSMPRYTPGEQKGKKVRVKYTVPIKFSL